MTRAQKALESQETDREVILGRVSGCNRRSGAVQVRRPKFRRLRKRLLVGAQQFGCDQFFLAQVPMLAVGTQCCLI